MTVENNSFLVTLIFAADGSFNDYSPTYQFSFIRKEKQLASG
jgi:hypothetical protein